MERYAALYLALSIGKGVVVTAVNLGYFLIGSHPTEEFLCGRRSVHDGNRNYGGLRLVQVFATDSTDNFAVLVHQYKAALQPLQCVIGCNGNLVCIRCRVVLLLFFGLGLVIVVTTRGQRRHNGH